MHTYCYGYMFYMYHYKSIILQASTFPEEVPFRVYYNPKITTRLFAVVIQHTYKKKIMVVFLFCIKYIYVYTYLLRTLCEVTSIRLVWC